MTLKSHEDIETALKGHTSVSKERKEQLLAHAKAAHARGKLAEFHGIVTSDESLKKPEVSFVTSLIFDDGKPAGAEEPVQPSPSANTTHGAGNK